MSKQRTRSLAAEGIKNIAFSLSRSPLRGRFELGALHIDHSLGFINGTLNESSV